jgi:hypothetical protein
MKIIDFNEILALIQAGQPVLCIDVREAYRQVSLDAGGWKIPYNEIARHAELLVPLQDCVTVVCCLRPAGSQRTTVAFRALAKTGVFRCPGTQKRAVQWLDSEGGAEGKTAGSGANGGGMMALLFLDLRWVKRNPIPTILLAVILISLSVAMVNWWQGRSKYIHV